MNHLRNEAQKKNENMVFQSKPLINLQVTIVISFFILGMITYHSAVFTIFLFM